MTETVSGASTRKGKAARAGGTRLRMQRIHTTPGVHPYDQVTWERRDVVMTNWRDGSVNFEQHGVEFPDFWSVNAANIVTTKYFRGAVGSPQREWSLKQLIDRVVGSYEKAGKDHGYFATDEDAEIFGHELRYALVHQIFSFNSPVWFNVGTQSPQQVSACFILAVDDTMDAILEWYREEGLIFKGGSGAGVNLSKIRSSKELLSSGGTASGPVSFMRGADASAGTIKSGGATRRAAKMVVLDVDHPDVADFITTKAREEEKVRVLRDAGFDMDLGGKDIVSVQYQNANNSVRVSDEFMHAVEEGKEFDLLARRTGEVVERVDARKLMRSMAQAAWDCADPGIQYDGTINDWHTCPESGRISASNPCSEYVHLDNSSLQPGQHQPAQVPPRRRHLRRGPVQQGDRADHHRDGHLDLLRRLPHREDRRDHPRLPPARHRLRQPRRAADGHRPCLRLRGRPGHRRGDHLADDRRCVQDLGRASRGRRPLRRLRAQRQAAQARHPQARGRQRADPPGRPHRSRDPRPGQRDLAASAPISARPTVTGTRRPACSRRPGPSA